MLTNWIKLFFKLNSEKQLFCHLGKLYSRQVSCDVYNWQKTHRLFCNKKFLYFAVTELNVHFYLPLGQMGGCLISVCTVWSPPATFTYSLLPRD